MSHGKLIRDASGGYNGLGACHAARQSMSSSCC